MCETWHKHCKEKHTFDTAEQAPNEAPEICELVNTGTMFLEDGPDMFASERTPEGGTRKFGPCGGVLVEMGR